MDNEKEDNGKVRTWPPEGVNMLRARDMVIAMRKMPPRPRKAGTPPAGVKAYAQKTACDDGLVGWQVHCVRGGVETLSAWAKGCQRDIEHLCVALVRLGAAKTEVNRRKRHNWRANRRARKAGGAA